jgi:FtsP/CotA-like multicopper oxidase with cupredoxin domain
MKALRVSAFVLVAASLVACSDTKEDSPVGGSVYTPQTRTYYIAADEVDWEFAPTGINSITGVSLAGNIFYDAFLGPAMKKSLYREYTDATFTTLKPVAPEWQHLGTLGPVIRGVVGDTLVIHFKNNTSFPASVHPHNVLYAKDSEGAPYQDGTSGADTADDIVQPLGSSHVYTWHVPARAGPAEMDGSSILSMYHSHVDETRDTNSGLIGPMIITRAENARPDGTPNDVDREFVNLFTVFNENVSLHIDANIAASAVCAPQPTVCDELNPDFVESNLKHSINGYIFGNLPGLSMRMGERVRWYLMGMGTEVDLHTPHWHGQTVTVAGMRTDVTSLLPATMVVANMVPDNPGEWLYHCHVNDHIDAGMIATFTVTP